VRFRLIVCIIYILTFPACSLFEKKINVQIHSDRNITVTAKSVTPDVLMKFQPNADNASQMKLIELQVNTRKIERESSIIDWAKNLLLMGGQAGIAAAGKPETVNKSYTGVGNSN